VDPVGGSLAALHATEVTYFYTCDIIVIDICKIGEKVFARIPTNN
jgi:hypothetical protein